MHSSLSEPFTDSTINFVNNMKLDRHILACVASNDALYILGTDYFYAIGNDNPSSVKRIELDRPIQWIFSDNYGEVYYIDAIDFSLNQVKYDEGNVIFETKSELNINSIVDNDISAISHIDIIDILKVDNYIYVLVKNNETNDTLLYRLNISDGTFRLLSTDYYTSMCHYKNGQILFTKVVFNQNEGFHTVLSIYDTLFDSFANMELIKIPLGYEVSYNITKDLFYLLGKNTVYEGNDSSLKKLGFVVADPSSGSIITTIFGNLYSIANRSSGTIQLIAIDQIAIPPKVITVSGDYTSDFVHAFMESHPDTPLAVSDRRFSTPEEIGNYIQTGQNEIDVFEIPVYTGAFEILRDKGYCYDLSQSSILIDYMNKTYAPLTDILYKDKELMGFPSKVSSYRSIAYNPDVWKRVGSSDAPPKNYIAFMDFMSLWIKEYSIMYPDVRLINTYSNIKDTLFMSIFIDYVTYYEYIGQPINFDTPLFNNLLEKFDEIKPLLEDYDDSISSNNQDMMSYLFYTEASILPGSNAISYEWLPLSLSSDKQPVIPVDMNVYIINPNSTSKDLALLFIEFSLKFFNSNGSIALCPFTSEPIANQKVIASIESLKQDRLLLEHNLPNIDPEDKKNYDEMKQQIDEGIKFNEDHLWIISQEQINKYRTIVPYLKVVGKYSYAQFFVGTLFDRYLSGNMSRAVFIKEIDRLANMMVKEN